MPRTSEAITPEKRESLPHTCGARGGWRGLIYRDSTSRAVLEAPCYVVHVEVEGGAAGLTEGWGWVCENMRGDARQSRVFILTCLNFSHLQSTVHLMQYAILSLFSYCSKQFLNSPILMLFSASAVFCFTSSSKLFPLRTFFTRVNKKIVAWGEIG